MEHQDLSRRISGMAAGGMPRQTYRLHFNFRYVGSPERILGRTQARNLENWKTNAETNPN
jgi:hypothetical protein